MKRTVETEQFYTDRGLAKRCLDLLASKLDLDSFEILLEPSAGDGAFLELLPAEKRIGIDVDPRAEGIQRADFFEWEPPLFHRSIVTIGNPPFGQRGALAVAFMERACQFSDVVAFVLPRSFKKYTFMNRVHPNFHVDASMDCDEFRTPDGEPLSIRSVFQIWVRRSVVRPKVDLPSTHPHFEMKHSHLSRTSEDLLARLRADFPFTIPQVGADFRPRDSETVDVGSHWFIRPLVAGVRARFERLDFSFLDGLNTAHKSLSKRDIVAAYQNVLDEENTSAVA